MAIEYTPEEIQAIFDAYHDAIRRGIPITEAMSREMADAVKGVKNYTAQLNYSIKQLGQSSKQAASAIANGAQGASVFSDTISSAGNVAANVASQFGVLGKAAGALFQVFTFWVGAVNKQSDALYKTFQDLSRSGAVGVNGMDDVFRGMVRLGYTVDQLDKMTALLAENSRDLAFFGGTAATGARQLTDLVAGMEDVRVQFRNLGLMPDDINKAAAGYYRQMARQGRLQEATSAGSIAYIKELETLTRLTGLQRKELEDQRERAEDIDQFYAGLMEMDPAAAKNAYQVFNQLMAADPSGKKARAFAVSMDGIIGGSEDQMQAIMSTNAQFLDLSRAVKEGRIDASQFMQGYSDAIRPNIELQKNLSKIGVTDFMGSLKNNVLLANKGLIPFAQQLGLSEQEIEALMKGTNQTTDAQSRLRESQLKSAQNWQEFINAGVNPVTRAMKILANAVEYLTGLLPFSGRAKARYEQEQQEQAASAASKVTGGIIDKIIQAESGGRNIANIGGTSSAYGIGQITKSTFEGLVKQATPGSALYGKTFEDMKTDVGLQRQALSQLTAQNQTALQRAGLNATDAATYLAHFLGATGATRVLSAPTQTPINQVVGADQIQANPGVFGNVRTSGDLIAWASRKMSGPSGAFGFRGVLSGPMSGYQPNITMHGSEELSIRPATRSSDTSTSFGSSEGMSKLLERMDDLIQVGKNQLGVNEKMLRYQQ